MSKFLQITIIFLLIAFSNILYAAMSTRITQFTNDQVSVWETIIYPSANQKLKMHRHEHDRVVVALNNGLVKVTNNKNKVHYLKFKKNQAYYLPKDALNELHTDQNMSNQPVKVLVIELKNS